MGHIGKNFSNFLCLQYRVLYGHRSYTLRPDTSGHLAELCIDEVTFPEDLTRLKSQHMKDRKSNDRLELQDDAVITTTSIQVSWKAPIQK